MQEIANGSDEGNSKFENNGIDKTHDGAKYDPIITDDRMWIIYTDIDTKTTKVNKEEEKLNLAILLSMVENKSVEFKEKQIQERLDSNEILKYILEAILVINLIILIVLIYKSRKENH